MPIQIINNDGSLSLRQLQQKMADGYSVVKSPHVGNQHPSNLVCAALGIPFNVVSFTSGERDKNFHPHLRIVGGMGTQIADPTVWTPFSQSLCGQSLESYHLDALKQRFPQLAIRKDSDLMQQEKALAEVVLRVMTNNVTRLWYRKVTSDGIVHKYQGNPVQSWEQIAQHTFRLGDNTEGWLVPNFGHILYETVLQALESGRDTVYHLSGPQMVGYIGGIERNLSKAYDALCLELPELPATLRIHIVPVASARMVAHRSSRVAFDELEHTIQWYERLPSEEKRYAGERFSVITGMFPEFTDSIECGTFLSHYDIGSADDLLLSDWMLEAPLKRVEGIYRQLLRSVRT